MAFTMKLSKGFLYDINYDRKPNAYIFAHNGHSKKEKQGILYWKMHENISRDINELPT